MIDSLDGDQLSEKMEVEGKKVILKGVMFNAKFKVDSPAQMPTPSGTSPDSMTEYSGGKGMFVNANMLVEGS